MRGIIKKIFRNYFELPYIIWFLVLLSVLTILTIDLNWFKIPEIFIGGHKLQNLFYQLSLGFLVSFVFYYVIIFRREIKLKESFKAFIDHELIKLYIDISNITYGIFKKHKKNSFENHRRFPNKNEIRNFFEKINLSERGYEIIPYGEDNTMWVNLEQLKIIIQNRIDRIIIRSPVIDPKLNIIITEIEHSDFLYTISEFKDVLCEENMGLMVDQFWDFWEKIEKLSLYCHNKYEISTFESVFE